MNLWMLPAAVIWLAQWGVQIAQENGAQVAPWIEWGVLGAFVLLMLTGQVVPGYLAKQKDSLNEELRSENRELRDKLTNEVVPALVESNRVLSLIADQRERDTT